MSDSANTLAVLRNRRVLIGLAVALVVVILWLVAFFLPQGSKLAKLNAQESALQVKVAAGNAHVAVLKREAQSTPKLEAMSKQLSGYVPATPDIFNYITTLQNTATAAGVTVTTLSPNQPTPAAGQAFATIAVAMNVTGTYDEILAFIKGLYGLPRLTSINTITITGGGQRRIGQPRSRLNSPDRVHVRQAGSGRLAKGAWINVRRGERPTGAFPATEVPRQPTGRRRSRRWPSPASSPLGVARPAAPVPRPRSRDTSPHRRRLRRPRRPPPRRLPRPQRRHPSPTAERTRPVRPYKLTASPLDLLRFARPLRAPRSRAPARP